MNKPKKLIRPSVLRHLTKDEYELIHDKKELNDLYILKVKEELNEIKNADFCDIKEFADLIDVVYSFAEANGISKEDVEKQYLWKREVKGPYENLALTNLNPKNPSNQIYFKHYVEEIGNTPRN